MLIQIKHGGQRTQRKEHEVIPMEVKSRCETIGMSPPIGLTKINLLDLHFFTEM